MRCIYHRSTDPYFNIATDEYITKYIEEECFMLWRNDNAIIVGKNQNTLAEINYDYVKTHNIHVVRRLSGGGAVYHDLGNLNFSFTKKSDRSTLIDFEECTKPIVAVLRELGINAGFEGRNDISIEGKKISGNAEYIYKNKILHHGTLLFSSKMKDVSEALRINPLKYRDKAVKSVPKRVTNIADHLKTSLTIETFTKKIMEYMLATNKDNYLYTFTPDDLNKIQKMRDEKYATREWNFGFSPDYNFNKVIRTEGGTLEMNLEVQNGVIRQAKIFGDFFNEKDISEIEKSLTDVDHEEASIRKVLSGYIISQYFYKMTEDDLIKAIF